jgi:hypothetical protein
MAPMADGPLLHPKLAALEFLVGTWKGKGMGSYPTVEPFEYLEVATFSHVGKPFLAYVQRTRDAATGEPLHAETGYLRPVDDGSAEFLIAQPSGIIEVLAVEVSGTSLRATSTSVVQTPTAKRVDSVLRQVIVTRNEMHYEVHMAAMGESMGLHLDAVLTRD